jgi:hypothetical protein
VVRMLPRYNFCIGSLQGLFNRPPLRERLRREFVFALTALKQCRIRVALCWLPAPRAALKSAGCGVAQIALVLLAV